MTRREFIIATALLLCAAVAWDVGVNGGKPNTGDDEGKEPP